MTAITLATALAQKGYKVALADSDNQKSSLQWLKATSRKCSCNSKP